jgi:Uncharacterized conserved protein
MTQLEFQWGTPIVVMGRRKPDWLLNEAYQFRLIGCPAIDWRPHEAGSLEPNWDFVESIRLPADHAAYSRVRRCKEPPVLIDHKYEPLRMSDENEPRDWTLDRRERRPTQRPVPPEQPAGWAFARVEALTDKKDPPSVRAAFARYIEAHELPPVDPDVAAVRRILTTWHLNRDESVANQLLLGNFDEDGSFIAALDVYRGIKAGGA